MIGFVFACLLMYLGCLVVVVCWYVVLVWWCGLDIDCLSFGWVTVICCFIVFDLRGLLCLFG